MALFQATVYSNELAKDVDLSIIIPQQTQKVIGTNTQNVPTEDIPVLYLLHGMGGNHTSWQRKSSIESYVTKYGIAVVMPSTDLGFYTNTTYDMNYWNFFSEELPELIHQFFPQLSQKREKTYAAGLSMGGYGAIKLGLASPERFGAVASLSGPLVLAEDPAALLEVRSRAYWEGVFGPLEAIKGSENDLEYLLEKLVTSASQQPRIFIACGEEDFLYPASQYFVQRLEANHLDFTFEHGPGAHNWKFWDEWIQRVLEWFFPEV